MVSWLILAASIYLVVAALLIASARRWRVFRRFLASLPDHGPYDRQLRVAVAISMWPFFAVMLAIIAPWMAASWIVIHFVPAD